jgi:hypothetical protein
VNTPSKEVPFHFLVAIIGEVHCHQRTSLRPRAAASGTKCDSRCETSARSATVGAPALSIGEGRQGLFAEFISLDQGPRRLEAPGVRWRDGKIFDQRADLLEQDGPVIRYRIAPP